MGWLLAPNGRWSARDKVGEAAIGAFLFTYVNKTRDFKSTSQDPGGLVLNPNPLRLDSSGEATIYWEDDEYYTIEVRSADPNNPLVPFELIYTEDNYPAVTGGEGGDVIINQTFPNLARNAQFTRWGNNNYLSQDTTNDTYSNIGGSTNETYTSVSDDWSFLRDTNDMTFSISRKRFVLGQSEVPANPVNYLNYNCTGVGAGQENLMSIVQDFQSVDSLSNQTVSAGFYAKSSSSSPIILCATQYFGSGGAPSTSVLTEIVGATLTPAWTQYSGTIVVPSVAGKTLGTNNNDFFRLEFRLPLNQTADIDICNVQLHNLPALPEFAYLPINDQIKRADTTSSEATFTTGALQAGIFTQAKKGWILCADQTIGSSFSGADSIGTININLFILLWDSLPNEYAPIFDSLGNEDVRGASAIEDFNANKRLMIIRTLGRVIGVSGSGEGLTPRPLGEFLGEEKVGLLAENNGIHSHGYQHVTPTGAGPRYWESQGAGDKWLTNFNTNSSGSGVPHQNMQPTTFATHMIKL